MNTTLRGGVMALGLLLSCREAEAEPVETARAFANAVQRGDAEAVIGFLEQRARTRLAQTAERASNQVGGRRNIAPDEMLQIVDVNPHFQVARAELISGDDDVAQVRLIGADRTAHVVWLVHENSEWKVRIPMPPETTRAPPSAVPREVGREVAPQNLKPPPTISPPS